MTKSTKQDDEGTFTISRNGVPMMEITSKGVVTFPNARAADETAEGVMSIIEDKIVLLSCMNCGKV